MKRLLAPGSPLFVSCIGYIAYTAATLPDVTPLRKTNPSVTALVKQRADERHAKPQPIQTWVTYKSISPDLRDAVVFAMGRTIFRTYSENGRSLHESEIEVRQIGSEP